MYYKAKKQYENQPGEFTVKQLFFAILPYFKEAVETYNMPNFNRTASELDKYGFFTGEYYANRLVWLFVSLLSKSYKQPGFTAQNFTKVFSWLQKLRHNRPSKEHSLLLKFFLKRSDYYQCFDDFIVWWDTKNLCEEDYFPEKWKDVTFPALVESLYGAKAKNLLDKNKSLEEHPEKCYDEAKHLATELRKLYAVRPQYKFFPYYEAKLRHKILKEDDVMEAFLPFARKNATQFWVWDFIAELHRSNSGQYLAFLCRAMRCRGDEDKKIGIRTKLAKVFVSEKMFNEARTEVDQIIQIRKTMNWPVPASISSFCREAWYQSAKTISDQYKNYKLLSRDTDHILFDESEAFTGLVSGVDTKSGKVWIIDETKKQYSFIAKKAQLHQPQTGMLINFFTENERVIRAKPIKQMFHKGLKEKISGKIKRFMGKNFALLEGAFIPPTMVEKFNLQNGAEINAIVIRSFNRKHQQWGWKMIDISS